MVELHEGTERPITTTDGVELAYDWLPAPTPRAITVLVHGFSAHRREASLHQLAKALLRHDVHVLAYDSRGHGQSGGLCAVGAVEAKDVAAAVREARSRAPGLPVILVGISVGAVAILRYLGWEEGRSDGVIGAVVVSGPARWAMRPSASGLLLALLTRTPPGRWVSSRWLRVKVAPGWSPGEPPESTMARVKVPVAVVHGATDSLVSPAHAKLLVAAAVAPVELRIVEGMGHGLTAGGIPAAGDGLEWVLAQAGCAQASGVSRS